jgi:hypothetical protein
MSRVCRSVVGQVEGSEIAAGRIYLPMERIKSMLS